MPGVVSFFETVFGETTGYLCISSRKTTGVFTERFFRYPDDAQSAIAFMRSKAMVENVYFCPQLLTDKKRVKTNVNNVQCIWADLDDCPPDRLLVPPTISLSTSPNRYQAIWALDTPVPGEDAEAIARKIAYGHSQEGSDRSGWDLTQLLRIPGTRNFKYGDAAEAPKVTVVDWSDHRYSLDDFAAYPQVEGFEYLDFPFPEFTPAKGEELLEQFRHRINGHAFTTFHRAPEKDRSTTLFSLEMMCFEAGMDVTQAFIVCRDSVINKWQGQDERLWKDICRAWSKFREGKRVSTQPPGDELSLLTDKEKIHLQTLEPSFVDRYVAWARTVGDAAVQYHVAGAFVALSSLLAGSIKLPTSYGTVLPNVWFMILADTTLTRKSTAMDLAMDIVTEIDESVLMATDGSIEGLLTAMQARSGQPSVFLRDEFTGLVQQMTKKDYLAGMPEFFTKLYDGKIQKRLLRKEEIVVRDPRLIVFAGGIKSKMCRILTHEQVESGFIPRFIIVTADLNPTRVKPLGPPKPENLRGRDLILSELREIKQAHDYMIPIVADGKVIGTQKQSSDITMTQEAWGRYNEIEQTLTQIGADSGPELRDQMIPMNVRLAVSILKCAMLLATARTKAPPVEIDVEDILRAASYGDTWRRYAQDVIINVGKGPLEHKITLVMNAVIKNSSMPRSRVMQTYHLTAREMDDIEKTLIGRGLITRGGEGRGTTYNSLME